MPIKEFWQTPGIQYTPFLINGYYPEGLEIPEIVISNVLNQINEKTKANVPGVSLFNYVQTDILSSDISNLFKDKEKLDKFNSLSGTTIAAYPELSDNTVWRFENISLSDDSSDQLSADIEAAIKVWIPSSCIFDNDAIFKTLVEPANS